MTYFIIRSIGDGVPSSMFPFTSGLQATILMSVYIYFNDPLDFSYFILDQNLSAETIDANEEYKYAVILALIGCFFGWLALESMVIGLKISKSAIASYGEMAGIVIPFIVDGFCFGR